MGEDWVVLQDQGYRRDAQRALQTFLSGEREVAFFARAVELLRTYTESSRFSGETAPTDTAIVELAKAIHHHVTNLGYLHQISYLWPRLIPITARLKQPELYAELVKQLSIIKEFQGNSHESFQLQAELIQSSMFEQLPPHQQVDILHHVGTALVWRGNLNQGANILERGLAIADQHPGDLQHKSKLDRLGLRSTAEPIPMWENKTYLLSQLGNAAMFRGEFEAAYQLYIAGYEIYVEHDEENNLACVSYQAMGRLFLHWGRIQEAISILEKGLAIRRRRLDQTGTAINTIYLAGAHLESGNLLLAESLLNEGLVMTRQLGNRRDEGLCYLYFGQLELLRGQQSAVFDQWQQALDQLSSVFTPLVEQRVFLCYLPWLFLSGNADLFQAVWSHLLTTARQQQIEAIHLARILQKFGFRK